MIMRPDAWSDPAPWNSPASWPASHLLHVVLYAIAATVIGTFLALATAAIAGAIVASLIVAAKALSIEGS